MHSVDIIGERPGTTRGLFESRERNATEGESRNATEGVPYSEGESILLESVSLLTAAGLPVLVPQLKALRALATTAERQALVESLSRPGTFVPRSQPPARPLVEQASKSQFDLSTPGKAMAVLRGA